MPERSIIDIRSTPAVPLPPEASIASRDTPPRSNAGNGFRFIKRTVAWLALFVGVYWLVYTIVDPHRNFFGGPFPQVIAKTRAEKLKMFDAYNASKPVTGVLLGSSRSAVLEPAILDRITGERYFNASVFGGHAEDYLAFYRLFRAKSPQLKHVLVGIDPLALDPLDVVAPDFESNFELVSSLNPSRRGRVFRIIHVLGLYKATLRTIGVRDLLKSIQRYSAPVEEAAEIMPDGVIHYAEREAKIRDGTYDHVAAVRIITQYAVNEYRRFDRLSPTRMRQLETLIREAQGDGKIIRLWIAPLHPEVIDAFKSNPAQLENYGRGIAYILDLSKQMGVPVDDLTDISAFGGDPSRWYDAIHYHPADGRKILSHLAGKGL